MRRDIESLKVRSDKDVDSLANMILEGNPLQEEHADPGHASPPLEHRTILDSLLPSRNRWGRERTRTVL